MTKYFARVELHDVQDEATYQTLHELMATRGFKRILDGGPDGVHALPTGTYYNNATAPLGIERFSVTLWREIENTLGKRCTMAIVEGGETYFLGLEVLRPPIR